MEGLVAAPVADTFVKSLIGAMQKEIKYVRKYKTYVEDLQKELKDLVEKRDMINHDVEKALNNGEIIEKAVDTWMNEVGIGIKEAKDFLETNDKSKKTCFRGTLPNLSTRMRISKGAEEFIQRVKILKERGEKLGPRISYPSPGVGRVTGTYAGANYHVTRSRDDLLKEISKALMESDVRIVGVSGRSGVGKSVLMKQVEKQVMEKKHGYDFEGVTFVTVGQTPNLEKIQDELAYRLELTFENEKSVEQKAHRLRDRLKRGKRTLMIFDDLWKKLDLEKLGIPPQGDASKHIKLLLTSRSKERLMNDMHSKQNFALEPLNEEEAVDLFENIVKQRINDATTLGLLQKQLVEKCAGLPIFIVPLAMELNRLHRSSWNETLKNLKQSESEGMKKFVEDTLGINNQVIEAEEVKALFLLCGQIGRQILSINDLLIYGMGIGFVRGGTMEDCRERLLTLLESLKSNGLLEDESNDCIKIHDLLSEVSLFIAKKEYHSIVLRDENSLENCSQDELKRCQSITIHHPHDVHKLPEGMTCQELNMFLLISEDCPLNFPDSFFNGMTKLKVLAISGVVLTSLPSSIELLHEIHTLCLDDCKIEDLRNIGKLKQLKMLTFCGSEISTLPIEIGELTDLRLLDLNRCSSLKVIERKVLGRLIHLEELVLPDTFDRWEGGATYASLNELNTLSCLRRLKICIPDVDTLPHDLPFGNLKRYKILIGGQGDCFMEYNVERTLVLKLNSDNSKIIWEDWVQSSLQSAQMICLQGWRGIEKSIIELSIRGFQELKHIDLRYSPRIQYIFRPNERFQFSLVESLYLHKLINLQKIYQSSLTTNSFTNLKSLRITACHKLSNLFSISSAKALSSIEEIEVKDCEMISEIIRFDLVHESLEIKGGADNKSVLMEFKSLRTLKLSSLPKILSFCATDDTSQTVFFHGQQVSFPCLESLTLSALPLLEKISHSEYPVELRRLCNLKVEACGKLSNAIDSQLLLQLKNLEELTIENCVSMNTCFNLNKSSANEATKNPIVQKPMSLKLVGLPILEAIWNMNLKDISLVQNLKQLKVSGCEQLKHLFSVSMASSLQSISHISIMNCKMMEAIFVEEKKDNEDSRNTITFPSLIELSISDMESLTMFASGNLCLVFPCLKQIEVRNCPKMSMFVASKIEKKLLKTTSKREKKLRTAATQNFGGVTDESFFFSAKVVLPRLEKLVLSSLESLQNIWEMSLSKNSFYNLAFTEIRDCDKLQTIFPLALMGRLQNLTELKVKNCNALKVLFESGEQDLMMCKLKDMSLRGLSNLEHLVTLSPSKRAVLAFPNLTNIKLRECHGLVDLFPIATDLSGLKNLEIASCTSMAMVFSVVAEDKEVASLEEMTFSSLCVLKLMTLENLTSFCSGHGKNYFPFLKELSIIGCTKLKAFITKPPDPTSSEDDSGPLFDEKVIFPNLQGLQIKGLKIKEIWHNKLPSRFLCKLKVLVVEDCNELLILIPSFMMNNLQSLNSLTVTECTSLEVIFKLEGYTIKGQKYEKTRSWKLNSIKLSSLPNLKCIWKGTASSEQLPFNELASLEVMDCKLLISILPVSMVYILEKLQELSIEDCKSLEQVIENEKGDHTGGRKKMVFSHLSSLKLFKLPELITFCAKHKTEWPSLEKLQIGYCDGVEAFVAASVQHFKHLFLMEKFEFPRMESLIIDGMSNLKEIWYTSKEGKDSECSSDAFCNLKTLQIHNCYCLSTILSSKMIRGFQNLEELSVESCNALEQVFEVQGNRAEFSDNNKVISIDFSSRELPLSSLPMMKQICTTVNPERVKLSFEKLQRVRVVNCKSLKRLFSASIAKYPHQLEDVHARSCDNMEEIVSRECNSTNNNIDGIADPYFFSFPKVTLLELVRLPNLESVLYVLHSSEWPSLERLEVRRCPSVKILATAMSDASNDTNDGNEFNNISDEHIYQFEKVNVSRLKSFETDMDYQEDERFPYDFVNLPSLTISDVYDQEEGKTFPWKLLLKKMHNVKKLTIRYSYFEELFPFFDEEAHRHVEGEIKEKKEIAQYESGGLACNGKRKHALGTLKVQSLQALVLLFLFELKHVWEQDSVMADILNTVESLSILGCDSLKILFPASASFLNLTKLDIFHCNGMVHLMTSSAASCLVQLTELGVGDCDIMEYIVIEDQDENGVERANAGASNISFPRLKKLRLDFLLKLESFSSATCHFNFPSLESVTLWSLPKLGDCFCKGKFTAPLLHEVDARDLGHEVKFS